MVRKTLMLVAAALLLSCGDREYAEPPGEIIVAGVRQRVNEEMIVNAHRREARAMAEEALEALEALEPKLKRGSPELKELLRRKRQILAGRERLEL